MIVSEGIDDTMSTDSFAAACIRIRDVLFDSNGHIQPNLFRMHCLEDLVVEEWRGSIVKVDDTYRCPMFTVQWEMHNGSTVERRDPELLWTPEGKPVLRMQVEKMGWGPHDSSEPLVFSEQVMGVPYSQASATNSRQESRAESRAVSPTRDLAASQAKPALPRPSSAAASVVSVNASEAHGVTSGRIQALSETVKTINAQIEGLQAQTFSSADVCEGLTEKVRKLERNHGRSLGDLERLVGDLHHNLQEHCDKSRDAFAKLHRNQEKQQAALTEALRRIEHLEHNRTTARSELEVDDEAHRRGYLDEMEALEGGSQRDQSDSQHDRSALPPMLDKPQVIKPGFADDPNPHYVHTYPVTRDHPDHNRIRKFITDLGLKTNGNEMRESVSKARKYALKTFDDRVTVCTRLVVDGKGPTASVVRSPYSVIAETAGLYRKLCKAMRDLFIEVECAQKGAAPHITNAMKEQWDRNVANSGDDGGLNPFENALSVLIEKDALEKPHRPSKGPPAATAPKKAPAKPADAAKPAAKPAKRSARKESDEEGFRSGSETE